MTHRRSSHQVGHTFEVEKYTVEVEKLLAQGGFANVYLARDQASEKRYALKKVRASIFRFDNVVNPSVSDVYHRSSRWAFLSCVVGLLLGRALQRLALALCAVTVSHACVGVGLSHPVASLCV